MTEHIRISAVIPTYNRGHIVGRAIESALAQEYAPSEVIIIDDGSNDRTLQVVETYGHRVRYVHQANAGVSASRNRGIREAEFELGGLPEQLRTREDTLLFFKLALLYPACAVSGCGTIMNSDDRIRLTQIYDGQTLVYCQATVFLFNELLASVNHIARDRRQL